MHEQSDLDLLFECFQVLQNNYDILLKLVLFANGEGGYVDCNTFTVRFGDWREGAWKIWNLLPEEARDE